MRPIAECVEEVRALGRPVLAILAETDVDDCSSWWEVNAVLPHQPLVSAVPLRWIEHEHFDRHFIAISRPVSTTSEELERAACIELGQALAHALDVPFYANPPEFGGAFIGWVAQSQSSWRKLGTSSCSAAGASPRSNQ